MTSTWKEIERTVAALVGGVRSWSSEDDIDVLTDDYAVEVKYRKGPTVAQIESWLAHNEAKAAGRGLKNALVIKRKAGRGTPTRFLLVIPLTEPLGTEEV